MRNKYLIEFILFTSYMLFAMSWVGSASFMKEIMQMTSMQSLTQASFLSTALTFAKIIGTFIAAWTIIKFGIRNAFTLASVLMCLSIVTPYATNFYVLLISRFFMGLGGALIIVYFNPIVYTYFVEKERVIINGLNAIAFNVGAAIMMLFSKEFVAIFGGWQNTLSAISYASISMLVLWLIFGKVSLVKPNNASGVKSYSMLDGLKDKFNWLYAFTYSGLLAFYIVLFTFYPKAGITQAKQVILYGIAGIILGMIYSSRSSKRINILRICGFIQLVAVFMLSFTANQPILNYIAAATLGFFMFLPMPALVTYAQERKNMPADKISITFSLFWSISYTVATVVTMLFAKIVDLNNGDYNNAFIFICIIEGTFFLGALLLKENIKD